MNMKHGHDMELTEWYFQTSRTLRSRFEEHIRYIKKMTHAELKQYTYLISGLNMAI